MSCECTSCLLTIRQPDTIWYVCTRYSYWVNYVCGTCVSLIPAEARHFADERQEFKISFGVLHAETGRHGNYQGCGSRQGPIKFWVEKEIVETNLPESELFLERLHPFYCPTEYLAEVDAEIQKGRRELLFEKGRFLSSINRHKEAVEALHEIGPSHEKYQEALHDLVVSYSGLGLKTEQAACMARITDPNILGRLKRRLSA